MNTARNVNILWVDDQITGFKPYVDALLCKGLVVSTADSTKTALRRATKVQFDVALVDILMPGSDGVECLRQLHRLSPTTLLAAFSSYLYLDKYREQLLQLDFPVRLLDKDFPHINAPDFGSRFLQPIIALSTEGNPPTIKEQLAVDAVENINPFDVPLQRFLKMPLAQKDRLVEIARNLAATTIDKAFDEGQIWVLLCGSKNHIRASAKTTAQIPNEERIMEFARTQKRAPFYFSRSVSVEDFWSPCGDSGTRHYPTVTLEFKKHVVCAHFDTGAPISFFSYEELVRMEAIKPTRLFGRGERKGAFHSYRFVDVEIEVLLKCQRGGEKKHVKIRGQAVREWFKSPFARHCTHECKPKKEVSEWGGPPLCPDRKALIGRNLLIENAMVLVLDGVERISAFNVKR